LLIARVREAAQFPSLFVYAGPTLECNHWVLELEAD
jgi:hypothetical protein